MTTALAELPIKVALPTKTITTPIDIKVRTITEMEANVGNLYAHIWEMFSDKEYLEMGIKAWHKWFRIEAVLNTVIPGKSVLDAGCGGGANIYMSLLRGASSVTGVDVSKKALDHTKRIVEKFKPEESSKVNLYRTSLLSLPFESNTFDVVFSIGVLHHTRSPYTGFCELLRVLKPGGTILVGVYGAGGLMTSVLIPLARFFKKSVPLRLTEKFLSFFTNDPIKKFFVMDPVYTEYRYSYYPEQILDWYNKNNLINPKRTFRCDVSYYKYGPWMSGTGWVGYVGQKSPHSQ